MALTGVRLQEPWEAEAERVLSSCRRHYSNGTKLLYLVHPGPHPAEGDLQKVAKEGIDQELAHAVAADSRAVLIYPSRGGVYVDPSLVTDVRGGTEEREWVNWQDIRDVQVITLVGGKLRKCLGATYQNIISLAARMPGQEISVRLPLDAIYTARGFTAAQELAAGVPRIGEAQSLCALLTSISPREIYSKSEWDYGFLDAASTTIHLNGRLVGTFGSSSPNPIVDLMVEYSCPQFVSNNLAALAERRWDEVRQRLEPFLGL